MVVTREQVQQIFFSGSSYEDPGLRQVAWRAMEASELSPREDPMPFCRELMRLLCPWWEGVVEMLRRGDLPLGGLGPLDIELVTERTFRSIHPLGERCVEIGAVAEGLQFDTGNTWDERLWNGGASDSVDLGRALSSEGVKYLRDMIERREAASSIGPMRAEEWLSRFLGAALRRLAFLAKSYLTSSSKTYTIGILRVVPFPVGSVRSPFAFSIESRVIPGGLSEA
jgi:hypothetical protein